MTSKVGIATRKCLQFCCSKNKRNTPFSARKRTTTKSRDNICSYLYGFACDPWAARSVKSACRKRRIGSWRGCSAPTPRASGTPTGRWRRDHTDDIGGPPDPSRRTSARVPPPPYVPRPHPYSRPHAPTGHLHRRCNQKFELMLTRRSARKPIAVPVQ